MNIYEKLARASPRFTRPEILCQRIPLALYGLTPRSIIGGQWWAQRKRAAALSNNNCCWCCGVHKSEAKHHARLEGAAIYEIDNDNKIMTFKEVAALCYSCNAYLNIDLFENSFKKGHIPLQVLLDVIKHGESVCKCDTKHDKEDFDKWVYSINWMTYKSKFKNFDEWFDFYYPKGELNGN